MLKQLSLVLPGCQPWFKDKIFASHISPSSPDILHFCYCSTLTLLRFTISNTSAGTKVKFHSLATPFNANMTSMSWNPADMEFWVVSTSDRLLHFLKWSQSSVSIEYTLKTNMSVPWLDYNPNKAMLFAYQDQSNVIKVMDISEHSKPHTALSITHECDITCARWTNNKNSSQIILGDILGNLYLYELSLEAPSSMLSRSKSHRKKLTQLFNHMHDKTDNEDTLPFITDIRIDFNADDYVLISFSNGNLYSVDLKQERLISTHAKISGKVASISWIPSIPGGFAVADSKSSALKLFSVSQQSHLETLKLLTSPIHSISSIIPSKYPSNTKLQDSPLKRCLFVSFDDGSVGIYDAGKRDWIYLRHGGHTETIFSCDALQTCNMSPYINQNELSLSSIPDFSCVKGYDLDEDVSLVVATSSYDGTVKMWDIGKSTFRGYPIVASPEKTSLSVKKSSLNGFKLNHNIGMTCNPPVDFNLLDSYPPFSAGRKKSDTATMETKFGIWYSVSWSSDGSLRWVSGSSRGTCTVYDSKLARIVAEFSHIHSSTVFRVSWNPFIDKNTCKTANMIASCDADGNCFVWMPENGHVFKKYNVQGGLYGCSWNHLKAGWLSAGCMDGRVIVWDTNDAKDTPKAVLNGHGSRVFHTEWSPLIPGLLATASDDNDVRIWKVEQHKCMQVLSGHQKKARCIVWNREIADIILTGSWDSDIRVWNVKNGECLDIVTSHAADIYGLSTFALHPFVFLSCSRDNTIRLWKLKLTDMMKKNSLLALADGNVQLAIEVLNGSLNEDNDDNLRLNGPLFQSLMEHLKSKSNILEKAAKILRYFTTLNGDDVFRKALLFLQKSYKTKFSYHDGFSSILRPDEMLLFSEIQTQRQESTELIKKLQKMTIKCPPSDTISNDHFNMTVSPSVKLELHDLRDAAKQRLNFGDIQGYCETMCLLGHWDRALAMAPAVNLDYWKLLIKRQQTYMETFKGAEMDIDLVLPFLLANSRRKDATDFLMNLGDETNAYLISAIDKELASSLVSKIVFKIQQSEQDDLEYSAKLISAWNLTVGQDSSAIEALKTQGLEEYAQLVQRFAEFKDE